MTHEGYTETARAFAGEVRAEKKALSLDPDLEIRGFEVKEDEDAGHRQRKRSTSFSYITNNPKVSAQLFLMETSIKLLSIPTHTIRMS